jgi:hypothetical protein
MYYEDTNTYNKVSRVTPVPLARFLALVCTKESESERFRTRGWN